MDYAKIIERPRTGNRDALVSSEEAAVAIETLLTERDAALAELKRIRDFATQP